MTSSMNIKRRFDLRILTSNDVYKPNKFSSLKTMIPLYQGKGITKCVFPGDFLGGSLFSVSHEGQSMIEVCNEVGFDYITLGNHEFDYGCDRLEYLVDVSTFKWLGSNVRYTETNHLFHKVLDYDTFIIPSSSSSSSSSSAQSSQPGQPVHDEENKDFFIKVGIFGVCTQYTPQLSAPTDALVFEDVFSHAKRVTSHLKKNEKCDIIIALTHISLDEDKLMVEVGNIDLILGGHDHEPYIIEHRDILIMKCGQNLDYLGVVDFHIDCVFRKDRDSSGSSLNSSPNSRNNNINSCYSKSINIYRSVQLISTYNIPSDPKIDEVIQKWKNTPAIGAKAGEDMMNMDEALTIVDLISGKPLSTKTSECRGKETSFCCILADAYKWLCEEDGLLCDFAIQNGGFVRADQMYNSGTTITRAIIAEELPFVQTPVLLEMKGKDVVEAIDAMLPKSPNPNPLGSYPHLSSGITACYDLNYQQNGRPSKVFDVKVNGDDIDLDKIYHVATTSFYVYEAADGVTAFNNKTIIKNFEHVLCKEAMMKYLATLDSISGVAPGRLIQITD